MKSKLIVLAVLFLSAICAYGQDSSRSPYPRNPTNQQETQRIIYENARRENQFERIRRIAATNAARNNSSTVTVSTSSSELTEKAKKYLKTDAAFQDQYKSFLGFPKTGIVNLLPEKACTEIESKPKIKFDKLIERCPFIFIPGGGGFFSFRQKDYVNYPLADIGFKDNLIFSLGSLNQGILVDLGDVNIEDISLTSKGTDFLSKYSPAMTLEGAAKESQQFESGLKVDGLTYKNVLAFEKDRTYGLRVVAYDLYSLSQEPEHKELVKSHVFSNDQREDIIVVFRVIEKSLDGKIVLLWKELRRTQSPEIMIPVLPPEK
jgi:hypothetical protein